MIRVGTCGGLAEKVKLRDIVIAATASTDSAMDRAGFAPWHFSPAADYGLLRAAADLAEKRGLRAQVGGIASSDVFYPTGGGKAYVGALIAHGVLAVEMETYALYTLAARHSVRALTVCAVTDSVITGEHLPPAER